MDQIKSTIQRRFSKCEDLMKSLAYLDPKRFVDINRGILLIDGDNHLLKRLTNLANVNHEKLIIELKDFAASFESLYLTINADLKKEKLYEVKKLSENDEDQKNQDEEDDFNSSNSENECKYCLPCVFRLLHKYNFHSSTYTNLYLTYKLILTLACTQVNCERSFSKLKIIETRLRASLGQELLEALLLISIEKDKIPNSERIISEFVVDVSGKGLAKVLLDTLQSIGINLDFLRGQGYDGASAMQGKFNGVQAIVKESYPLALYLHCSSHSLNLCISNACNLKPIRNATGTLQAVCVFLRTPKRQDVLEKAIDKFITDTRKKKLKKLCPTRWVERHEAVLVFLELYDAIVEALENISSWNDRDTSFQASNLLCSIKQGEFLICIFILVNVFSVSLPLSKKLQDEHLDLTEAIELAENVIEVTTQRRAEAEKQFKNIYNDVLKKSEKFDINIKVPRLANKQEHRTNVITDSAESYYRVSLYIPFLDSFNQQLNDRFLAHKSILSNFLCLVKDKENSDECFKVLLKTYEVDIEANVHSALGEFSLWKQQIKSKPITNVVSALAECNENIYPSIYTLLNILASLPVITATSERSFSTLRRLKTYLRNTITENRLNGLALMNIHRDVKVTVEEVIENMARKSRRIRLL
ncbi:hypothetical protein QTP88_001869 [Uroleucon formosanum]